jgi:hypothetical protein
MLVSMITIKYTSNSLINRLNFLIVTNGGIQLVMKDKLRVEDELLLCCARTNVEPGIRDKILFLVQGNLDWDYLLKLAMRHRLIPLLYYNLNSICAEDVPESILSQLKGSFHENVRRNLLLTGELIKILKLLKAEGVDAIPYKGPVLASLAYENLSLRESGDIDLFIDESDVILAKDVLISNGYDLNLNNISNSKYLKSQREYKFMGKNPQIPVEIHWSVYGVPFYVKNTHSYLHSLENTESIKIANSTFLSFNPEVLLLILSLHCAGHRWEFLMWICDLAEIIQRYELNWDKIIKESKKIGIKRVLLINLALVIDLFETEVPKKVLSEIRDDKYAEELSMQIRSDLFKEKSEKHNLIKCSLLQIKMREDLKEGVIDLLLHIFAPTTNELSIVSLPDALFFLYYILRPFYLIKNHSF